MVTEVVAQLASAQPVELLTGLRPAHNSEASAETSHCPDPCVSIAELNGGLHFRECAQFGDTHGSSQRPAAHRFELDSPRQAEDNDETNQMIDKQEHQQFTETASPPANCH